MNQKETAERFRVLNIQRCAEAMQLLFSKHLPTLEEVQAAWRGDGPSERQGG